MLDTTTPGPWIADHDGEAWYVRADHPDDEYCASIADLCRHQDEALQEANAKLLALAPKMYAALVEIRDSLRPVVNGFRDDWTNTNSGQSEDAMRFFGRLEDIADEATK